MGIFFSHSSQYSNGFHFITLIQLCWVSFWNDTRNNQRTLLPFASLQLPHYSMKAHSLLWLSLSSSLKWCLLKASQRGLTPPGRRKEFPLAVQTTWKSYSAFVPVGAIDFVVKSSRSRDLFPLHVTWWQITRKPSGDGAFPAGSPDLFNKLRGIHWKLCVYPRQFEPGTCSLIFLECT